MIQDKKFTVLSTCHRKQQLLPFVSFIFMVSVTGLGELIHNSIFVFSSDFKLI